MTGAATALLEEEKVEVVDSSRERTTDLGRTENMLVNRLGGSGCVPALRKTLQKFDGR